MAFRVGQKVGCVDAGGWPQISIGTVYTVHSINNDYGCWLRLKEVNPELGGYRASRFRPIVERKTDISCFTAMLNPSLEDLAGRILSEVVS